MYAQYVQYVCTVGMCMYSMYACTVCIGVRTDEFCAHSTQGHVFSFVAVVITLSIEYPLVNLNSFSKILEEVLQSSFQVTITGHDKFSSDSDDL